MRRRGSKRLGVARNDVGAGVAPHAEAWIETSAGMAGCLAAGVAPHAGARFLYQEGAYQSVRSRSTDFGQVGLEPGQMPTALKPAFDLGF